MLYLHFSNRHEILARRLGDALAASRAGVFERERVLVPSAAWQRWLSLHLARRLGICTQVEFGFLAPWLWQELPPEHPLRTPAPATEALAWRTWAWLGREQTLQSHPRLAQWLARAGGSTVGDGTALARYELARDAAAQIEQIETWRPRWVAAWRRGENALAHKATSAAQRADEAWHAALWRHLRLKDGAAGAAAVGRPGSAGQPPSSSLPVHLFAPPAIPPLHLAALRELATARDVHVYVANPCREYWFDLVSPRRLSHLRLRGHDAAHEVGHGLLMRWGAAMQAPLAAWNDAAGSDGALDDGEYVSNAERSASQGLDDGPGDTAPLSLLHQLQDSLLDLTEPGPGGLHEAPGDRSLELHVCHSLERELEVLQQRLLALLAADPTIGPGDIWVALPQLDAAAPLIDAVFGSARGHQALPYAITGRSQRQSDERAGLLLSLLDLAASRCTASAVLGLMQAPGVAQALGPGLDTGGADDVARASAALLGAGFHWGLDDAHLARHGAPPHGGTLTDALGRLALGACVPAEGSAGFAAPWAGLLALGDPPALPWPAPVPSGQTGLERVGALWRFSEALQNLARELSVPRPAQGWFELMERVQKTLLAAPDDDLGRAEQQALRQRLAGVARTAAEAIADDGASSGARALDPALPWPVWRAAVHAALDDPARGGVASGAITFSALAPLRGLPFRVVALLGLDDGVFPSPGRAREHDLMAAFPEPGDRQRRLDDRALFLDAVLAARQTLHLSHSGRSALDNSPRPPSVLVAELLEWLLPALCEPTDDAAALNAAIAAARSRRVVEHPLQPFDLAAYDREADPRLRSSEPAGFAAWQARLLAPTQDLPGAAPVCPRPDRVETDPNDDDSSEVEDNLEGAEDDTADPLEQDREGLPFIATPLAAPTWNPVLDATELERWLDHPARHWLRQRLGLRIPHEGDEPQDDEALDSTDGALRRALWQRWLPLLLDLAVDTQPTAEAVWPWVQRQGLGPPAGLGQAWLATEWPALRAFAAAVRGARAEADAAWRDSALASTAAAPVAEHLIGLDVAANDAANVAAAGLSPFGTPQHIRSLRWQPPPRAAQRVVWHPHRLKGRRVGAAWLHHLLACAAAGPHTWPVGAVHTRLLAAPDKLPQPLQAADRLDWPALDPCTARGHLSTLVAIYEHAQGDGGCLLPNTAWAWLTRGRKTHAARGAWQPSEQQPYSEGADAHWRLLFRGRPDPVAEGAFEPWAEAAFGPAWAARATTPSAPPAPNARPA